MRKRRSIVVGLICALSLQLSCFAAQDKITVKVNGQAIDFKVNPIVENDRTLVSLREIFESLGANVKWVEETKEVIATKDNTTIKLQIDNKNAVVNNKNITLDVPAKIVNSKTVVPVRFISESLGTKVDWDDNTQTVLITNNNSNNTVQNTYNNTQNYSTLYQALKSINFQNYEGSLKDNSSIEIIEKESTYTNKVSSILMIDKNKNMDATLKKDETTTYKDNKIKSLSNKMDGHAIILNNNLYIQEDNAQWMMAKLEDTKKFQEGLKDADSSIKMILELFNNIKTIKVTNDKEYELELSDINSSLFNSYITNDLSFVGLRNMKINQYVTKITLNEKNEVIKISTLENVEGIYDNDKVIFKSNADELLNRGKVEIKAPSNFISADSVNSIIDQGTKLIDAEKYKEAIDCFDKVLNIDSKNDIAYYYKALALYNLDKCDEALTCINKSIDLAPEDAASYVIKGDILDEQNKNVQALENYNEAIKLDPSCVDAYYGKGIICGRLNSYQEAFTCFEKYTSIVNDNPDAYIYLGMSLSAQEKYSDSIKYYDKAINLDSKRLGAYYQKALSCYSLEQYDNVIKNCDIVTNLDSKHADAYYLKASCYAIQNNTSKAIENIKKAVELDEDYLEIISDDEDFDGIRNTDIFKNLIKDLEKKSMKKYINN